MLPTRTPRKPSPPGRGLGEGPGTALTRRSDDLPAQLRRQQTDVERKLWFELRDRRLNDSKFRRQAPIGPYVVDFLCLDSRLIIELDGGQHAEESAKRQSWLESQGYKILRFWNNQVAENLPGVLAVIAEALTPALSRGERENKKPSPPGRGLGEGRATSQSPPTKSVNP